MNRLSALTIAGGILAGLTLAVFAYFLADAQRQDREEVERRFEDVAQVSAAVTDGIFQSSLQGAQEQAATQFSGETVDEAALAARARRGQLSYTAVLDDRERTLAATDGAPEPGPAVDVALETGEARLSDVMGEGEEATIEWAIPYETEYGRRVYVQGIPLSSFAAFLEASLSRLPNPTDAETAMVDSNGVVLGGARLSTDVGEQLRDKPLMNALEEADSGEYGDDRYFASGEITGSPFRIVLDTSEEELYDSISGRAISWVIFAAFALAALAGLLLLRRASATAAELQRKELNERHAGEINDNIIQGLALAKYQLQAGQGDASATQVSQTLREAQRLVSGLLGDAEVQAGQLRRGVAAETGGPTDPPPSSAPATEDDRA